MKLPKFAKITVALSLALGLSLISSNIFTSGVYADDDATENGDICSVPGVSDQIKAASGCPDTAALPNLADVIVSIVNGVIGVTGVVAVIFIVIAGINYITSAGDAAKIEKAKRTIIYALIGLAVCALSFAIVNFAIVNIIHGQSSGGGSDTTTSESTDSGSSSTSSGSSSGSSSSGSGGGRSGRGHV